jgi:hypothetical protein
MFEQTFKNMDDVLRAEAGCTMVSQLGFQLATRSSHAALP